MIILQFFTGNILTRRSRNPKGALKNPKSEYRNPKQIPNPKFQIQEGLVWNIGILKLFTCLEFRAWNLGFPSSPLTEELSCQFAHNFIDERLRGME
ncbi:MAG: hypothetical protein A2Z51_07990 [Deltaproteobacteria bacterium RBG_19FT_COMBO_52_11]|nr:MAG: hypothetical protein A2Z51_07990 [Deltaproteobacteria bacterium RBG_19FT_COMBO_52_11]